MTHTPGPWKVQRESDGDSYVYIRSSAALGQIATVYERPSVNAPLIAAAPDMLAILKEWLLVGNVMRDRLAIRERARAAISKAEGKL